jgi:hypothetical protein
MSFNTIAPIILSVSTALGVLVHDMHVDRATTAVITIPVAVATAGAAAYIGSSDHTHVERASIPRHMAPLRSSLPKIQPPRDDDRRYVMTKKLYLTGGGDQSYLWPSV